MTSISLLLIYSLIGFPIKFAIQAKELLSRWGEQIIARPRSCILLDINLDENNRAEGYKCCLRCS